MYGRSDHLILPAGAGRSIGQKDPQDRVEIIGRMAPGGVGSVAKGRQDIVGEIDRDGMMLCHAARVGESG
jgi:hypothetical protein